LYRSSVELHSHRQAAFFFTVTFFFFRTVLFVFLLFLFLASYLDPQSRYVLNIAAIFSMNRIHWFHVFCISQRMLRHWNADQGHYTAVQWLPFLIHVLEVPLLIVAGS